MRAKVGLASGRGGEESAWFDNKERANHFWLTPPRRICSPCEMSITYNADFAIHCQVGWITSRTSGEALRLGCGRWPCPTCGPRRRRQWVSTRCNLTQSYATLKFITLTLPAGVAFGGYRQMQRGWRLLWQWLRRNYGLRAYVWVTELTQKSVVHRHAILDVDYVPQRALSNACARFGLGRITDIRAIKGQRSVNSYVTKYLTKSSSAAAHPRYARRCQSSVRAVRAESDHLWFFQRIWQFLGRDLRSLCPTCRERYPYRGIGTQCAQCEKGRLDREPLLFNASSLDSAYEKVHRSAQEVCHDLQIRGPGP